MRFAGQVSALYRAARGCSLICADATGIGAAVCEMIEDTGLPVVHTTITGGRSLITHGPRRISVGKMWLMQRLRMAIVDSEFQLDKEAPGASELVTQLRHMLVQHKGSGYKIEARTGLHDDLALAASLAILASDIENGQTSAATAPKDDD